MRFVRTAENLFGLPLGFTRVEYLQSTGTQYIDTGVKAKTGLTVEARLKYTTNTGIFCGAITTAAGTGDRFYPINFAQSNKVAFTYLDSAFSASTSITNGSIYTIKTVLGSTKQEMFVDGVSKGSTSKTNVVEIDCTLGLFALHRGEAYDEKWVSQVPASLYYCKIWDGNTLVRDFIPCIDPLGVACMYDLVGKKPYYNQGTGTFTVGRQVIPVEYLESTGTQYIDMLINPKQTTKVISNFELTSIPPDTYATLFGAYSGTSANGYALFLNNTVPIQARTGTSSVGNIVSTYNVAIGKYEVALEFNKLLINGDTFTGSNTWSNVSNNMYLFNANTSSSAGHTRITPCRIYFTKVYEGDTLVRDFIPCKDENNVGFMFDALSGTVYLNAGTGAFSVGENKYTSKLRLIKEAKELPDGYKRVEYLQSDGNQYVDTEYTINTSTDEVLFNFQMISTTLYQWIMGEHDNGARFGVGVGDGTNKRNIAYGATTYKVNDAEIYNSIHYFKANSNGVYLNGTQVHGFETFSSSSTIYLFRLNLSGSNGAAGKIWRYIQKRNGVLIRDMIPCLDQNNTPCMFDLVDGKPYYNLGTGNFTYGHIITPVEYLESDGTGAYIKTGLTANFNTKAEVIFKCNEMVGSPAVLGGRSSASIAAFCIWGKSNAGYVCCNFSNTGVFNSSVTAEANTKYLAVLDNSGYTVNGSKTEITTTTTFTSPELYMFDANGANTSTSGTGNRKLVGKIYGAKIWDNGTLVRSFIPVRDENNVGYMFDEVTGQLFGNAGSGSFGIGNDLPKYKVRFIQDVIPSAYLPLKYLESTGTQYIDLGVGVKSNTVFKATFSIASTATGRSYFGARNSSNERFQIVNSIGIGGGYYLSNTVYPLANQKYEIEMHANGDMYLDGVKRSATTGTFSQVAFGRNLWLFATNYYDSSVGPGASTFWSVIIYEGNVPVRDLYPALRKSDNKPGMYDRITKQFYVNQGTGEFNYEV